MASPDRRLGIILVLLIMLLSACGVRPVRDGAPTPGRSSYPPVLGEDPVPRDEPKSTYGNGPYYNVYGQAYKVLDTNYGYQERGVASWYGSKFHGQPTSSRERYDMYEMTAAHKTLPLPSYVRVRNLANGKSVVVRVNDRGPFVANRLIDLSYAAAVKLDMITDGTSLVEVTAISFDEAPPAAADFVGTPAPAGEGPERPVARAEARDKPVAAAPSKVFVQVGAFGEAENARRRFAMLRDVGIDQAFVHRDDSTTPALYRVRIGPIADVLHYDTIVQRLLSLGIADTHLVTD